MQQLTDIELFHLAVEGPEFAQDPFRLMDEARKVHPWLAQTSFGYMITEYRALRDMIVNEPKLRMGLVDLAEFMGAEGTLWGKFIADNIEGQTGETHKRLRNAVNSAFTPGKLKVYRPMMRDTIVDLLDEWAPKGKFDFEEFVSLYPVAVICKMLGAPPEVIPRLKDSLEALGLAFSMDRSLLPLLNDSVKILDDFVRDLVAGRRAKPSAPGREDLLDNLLDATAQGKMDDEELFSLLIFLFGAGYDTSKNVLTMTMRTLLDHPGVYERCAEDLSYCRKVMNESLRFMSPASSTRHVLEPFEFRGVWFPEGTVFLLPWSISGRDETAVPNPGTFDPDREEGSPHMAFGAGPHICLGQFIAKAQIEEGLYQIARRIRRPKLAGEYRWRPFPGVWGLHGLPIEFEPAKAYETQPELVHPQATASER
jgi:cytochrome P450